MKKIKAAVVAAAILLSAGGMALPNAVTENVVSITAASAADSVYTASGYTLTYKETNGTIEITGFNKTSNANAVAVTIPSKINNKNVTKIGSFAFYYKPISSVVIPDTVESLGDYSFSGCDKLTTVTLSKNLKSSKSGGYLFYNSCNIETVNCVAEMPDPTFIDHFNYHTDTVIKGTFAGSRYKLEFEIPVSEQKAVITRYTSTASGTKNVVIPDTILGREVRTIGTSAFNGCDAASIKMSDNIVSIKGWAFNNCTNLKKLTLSRRLSTAASESYLFNGTENVTQLIIPDNMDDPDFIAHLVMIPAAKEYVKNKVDARVNAVYTELRNNNPSIEWNIPSQDSPAREDIKYHIAKYIFEHMTDYITYDNTVPIHDSSYSLVRGRGACAGFTKSYLLLLQKAGFRSDEIEIISSYHHQVAGIKLYGQWYFVDSIYSDIPSAFCSTYNEYSYVKGYAEVLNKYGYYLGEDTKIHVDVNAAAYVNNRYSANFVRGDVNMDGTLCMSDAVTLSQYLSGLNVNINLVIADVDRNGVINHDDVTRIQHILLHLA